MILCHCKTISDRQIKDLITQGHQVAEIQKICGAGQCCGSCKPSLEKLCASAEMVTASQHSTTK